MDRLTFNDYISRFNAQDPTAFDDYIAENMHMKNGGLEFTGRQGMKDAYARIWQGFTEELYPSDFVGSDTAVAIRMRTLFTALHADQNAPFGPVEAGTKFEYLGVIHYRLDKAGQFEDILVAYDSFRRIDTDGTVTELGIPA